MRPRTRGIVLGLCLVAWAGTAGAVPPTERELARRERWVRDHFAQPLGVARQPGDPPPKAPELPVGLRVLANFGPVQLDRRDGQPLRIATTTFTRGLYCHAMSRLLVRLPGPAKSFQATVGIDTNGDYTGGSVTFSVFVGQQERFRSPVLHRGEAGVPIALDLDGAREFVLAVGDGEDNFNSDQADWADAKVILADGQELWLGDLPLIESAVPPRNSPQLPFFFQYDGRPSDLLLPDWQFEESTQKLDAQRTERRQSYRDPKTGLVVRVVLVEYADYPTVEWTLFFENTGTADTPILEWIRPLDLKLSARGDKGVLLHHFVGSPCAANDYQPLEKRLTAGATARIATQGGRPTNSDLPYFNLETIPNAGVIAVVGWAGQWAVDFLFADSDQLRISGGQELTHFRLHPGESVRTPLAVLQFYEGDWLRAQNVWRAWMIAHNLPRPSGQPLRPQISACSGNHYPGIITNAAEELHFLRRYFEEKIPLDYWWQDAGWYPCDDGGWPKTGTWEVEKKRWPHGIREVSDFCRKQGVKTIVWFEPERVAPGTWLADTHPEWIFGGKAGGLLKLGDPACRAWLVEHIDRLMTKEGIDLYRQDFNIDPLSYWRNGEAEDRQGINEIRHVEGYLAYWDELLRRRPGMLIDSCASGGRRNDLETLRRAVPLLRSDYLFEPVGEQNHTYGISFWMPFNGTGLLEIDPYLFRSQMSPELTLGFDTRRTDLDFDLARKLVGQWQRVSPAFFGDYWPLSGYSLANNVWMAWQFDRPDLGEGFVQAFRRAECEESSLRVKLRGLQADATYTLTDLDSNESRTATGRQLEEEGLLLEASQKPQAILWAYRRS